MLYSCRCCRHLNLPGSPCGYGRPQVFLGPAGLLYVLMFGYSYQTALEKHTEIRTILWQEVNVLRQIIKIVDNLEMNEMEARESLRYDVCHIVLVQAVDLVRQLKLRTTQWTGGETSRSLSNPLFDSTNAWALEPAFAPNN